MIQLQYVINGENAGGLYVNVQHISSVRHVREGNKTMLLLSNGIEYQVVNPMMELLDEIYFALDRHKK